jgi:integrase
MTDDLQLRSPGRQTRGRSMHAMYADLLKEGRIDGGGGLSPRTVRYVHTILHRALRDAVRWGKLARNPADLADPPKQSRPTMTVWSAGDLRAFLDSVRDDRLAALWMLAATTGMRRGELLGLTWTNVGQDRVHVRETRIAIAYQVTSSLPKSRSSRRAVVLDPQTMANLRAHRKQQMEQRLARGPGYVESDYVFTRENGEPIHPEALTAAFERHVAKARLPRIRFHDLRHTYATVALSAGIHPKIISERLGHASIGITLDTYSHVLPSISEGAANEVANFIFGT